MVTDQVRAGGGSAGARPLETVPHQSEHAKDDQVAGNDIVQKLREYQYPDACAQGDQRSQLNVQGQDGSPSRRLRLS